MFEQNHYRFTAIVVPSIVWCYKCPKTYVYCAVLIMVAANANSGRPAIIYSRLLTKLKAVCRKKFKRIHAMENKFYPSETQRQLLDVCSYKDFFNPLGFETVREVNQFVTKHVDYQKEFEKIYGGLRCPGVYLTSRISILSPKT